MDYRDRDRDPNGVERGIGEGLGPPGDVGNILFPQLTHLQFLVEAMLMSGPRSGRSLRIALDRAGVKKAGPAFYQLMARLEEEQYVRGWYEQRILDSHEVRERNYELTSDGREAWERACDFYRYYSANAHQRVEA